jgi:hypothetical protein
VTTALDLGPDLDAPEPPAPWWAAALVAALPVAFAVALVIAYPPTRTADPPPAAQTVSDRAGR